MTHNTIGDLHPDALVLASKLREVPEGEIITYAALSTAIGADVQNDAYARLDRARKIVFREDRIVFGTVTGEGLKRLDASGIVHSAPTTRERARRLFRRELARLKAAEYQKLSDADKLKWNVEVSQNGAIYAATTNKVTERIQARIAELKTPAVLPLASTLELFRSGSKEKESPA